MKTCSCTGTFKHTRKHGAFFFALMQKQTINALSVRGRDTKKEKRKKRNKMRQEDAEHLQICMHYVGPAPWGASLRLILILCGSRGKQSIAASHAIPLNDISLSRIVPVFKNFCYQYNLCITVFEKLSTAGLCNLDLPHFCGYEHAVENTKHD